MRVAVANLIADPVLGGGTAVKSVALTRALAAAGADARLITTDLGLRGGSLPDVGSASVSVLPTLFQRFPVPRGELKALIAGCDAVILVNHWNMLNARVYRAAKRLEVPILFCPAGALRIQGRSRWLKLAYHTVVGRHLLAEAEALIATTTVEAAEFRAAGVPPQRIHVIPNGIDTEPVGFLAEEFRTRYGLYEAPVLLFMGRLNVIKGPDLLLEAFVSIAARFPEWHLVAAGRDEGLAAPLRARAAAAGVAARVHFVGHLSEAESTGAYRAASLLVIPSRHEAMSLVALEAGVNGTPVLLTDVCGFDEVERAGGGRVVAPTASAIAQGLGTLLEDASRLPSMGAHLREMVVARFGWPTVVQQYIALATRLQRERGR